MLFQGFLLALLLIHSTCGQLPPGVTLQQYTSFRMSLPSYTSQSSRRIPQIAPRVPNGRTASQGTQTNPSRQGNGFAQFAPNPLLFNSVFARRLNMMETELRRVSASVGNVGNNLRVTLSSTLAERLSHVQQDIDTNEMRSKQNKGSIDNLNVEISYLKNSNDDMQRRLDRIEELQERQSASIQNIVNALQSSNNHTILPATGINLTPVATANQGAQTDQNTMALIRDLGQRINETETAIANYESYFQSFAGSIDAVNRETEMLRSDAESRTLTLGEMSETVYNMQNEVDLLKASEQAMPEDAYESEIVTGDFPLSLEDLSDAIRVVERKQSTMNNTIQNITAILDTKSRSVITPSATNTRTDINGDNFNMLIDVATTVAAIEESLKQAQDADLLKYDLITQRVTDLETDAVGWRRNHDSLLAVCLLQNIQQDIEFLNQTSQRHEEIFSQIGTEVPLEPGPDFPPNYPTGPYPPSDYVELPSNSSGLPYPQELLRTVKQPTSNGSYVTFEFLEQRLRGLNDEERIFPQKETDLKNLLDSQENRINNIENLVSGINPPQNLVESRRPNVHELEQVKVDLNALNASVAFQASMLSQGIGELANYQLRLREKDIEDQTRLAELNDLRYLIVNATESLSKMSLSIAEHELIIPSIFESLKTSDEILLDLSSQTYENADALQSLNRSIISSSSNTPNQQDDDLLFRSSLISPDNFATKSELSTLQESLDAVVADTVQRSREEIDLQISNLMTISSSPIQYNQLNNSLQNMKSEFNGIRDMVSFQQSEISRLTLHTDELSQVLDETTQSFATMKSAVKNMTRTSNDSAIRKMLETNVKQLGTKVHEHRRWLGNQRRRIRNLEGMNMDSFARSSDLTLLNNSISAELSSTNVALETLSAELSVLSEQVQGSILPPHDQALSNYEIPELDRNTSNSIDTNQPLDNLTEPNQWQQKLLQELRSIPSAIRVLQSQIHSFQEPINSVPTLNTKVETLIGMRNLVFQNAGDITSFHQVVTNLEKDILGVSQSITNVGYRQDRIDSYHADFRNQLNITKAKIDQTDDRAVVLKRRFDVSEQYISRNYSVFRDRLTAVQTQLRDSSTSMQNINQELQDLEGRLQTQDSENLQFHNQIESRVAQIDKRIEVLSRSSSNHDDAVVRLTQQIREEGISRTQEDQRLTTAHDDLRSNVEDMGSNVLEIRHTSAVTNQQVAAMQQVQTRNTAEATRILGLQSASDNKLRTASIAVEKLQNDVLVQNGRLTEYDGEITEVKQSIATQTNNILSARQSIVTVNDQLNALDQRVQRYELFIQRAEQAITKHRSDISFILDNSVNQTVAIERLKQRIGFNPQESFSNITNEILSEMEILTEEMQAISNEVTTFKRQSGIRENSVLQIEARLTEVIARSSDNLVKVNSNKAALARVNNDLNRQNNRIIDTELAIDEQRSASNDLQQVVGQNRNNLATLSNMQSTFDHLTQGLTNAINRQSNKTRFIETSYKSLKQQFSGVHYDINEHTRLLGVLRQGQISLEADINQIYQSSASMEQVLRNAVSNLTFLERNINSAGSTGQSGQGLDRRLSGLQSELRQSSQIVTTNENKLSHLQELVEQLGNSMADVIASLEQKSRTELRVQQSRSSEVQEVRNKLDQTSHHIRALQRELQHHNERLHILNQRLIDRESRTTIHQVSPEKETDKENNDFLSASGWLPEISTTTMTTATTNIPSDASNQSNINSVIETLLSQLNSINLAITSLEERFNQQQQNFNSTTEDIHQRLELLKNRNTHTNSGILIVISTLEDQLSNVSSRLDGFVALTNQYQAQIDESEKVSVNASKLAKLALDTCVNVNASSNAIANQINTSILNRSQHEIMEAAELAEQFKRLSDLVEDQQFVVSHHAHNNTESDVIQMSLQSDFMAFSSHLKNLTSTLTTKDSKKDDIDAIDRRINGILSNELDSASLNLTQGLETMGRLFTNVSGTVEYLLHGYEQLRQDVNLNNRRDAKSVSMEQLSMFSNTLGTVQGQIRTFEVKLNELEKQHNDDVTALYESTSENTRSLERVSTSVVEHSLMLSDYNSLLQLTDSKLRELGNQVSGNTDTWVAPVALIGAVEQVILTLKNASSTFTAIADKSPLVEIETYTAYEDHETDYSTKTYPDTMEVTPDESENIFKVTNMNIANVLVNLSTSVQSVLESMTNSRTFANSVDRDRVSVGSNLRFSQLLERINGIEDLMSNQQVPNFDVDNITNSISALSQQIQMVSLERLESYGRNENISTDMMTSISELRSGLSRQQGRIDDLAVTTNALNSSMSGYRLKEEVQDTQLNNLVLMQSTFNREVSECKQTSRELNIEIANKTETLRSQMEEMETRLLDGTSQISQRLSVNQESMLTDMFGVMDDVLALNFTLVSVMNFVTDMQEEVRLQLSTLETLPLERVQSSIEQHGNLLNNLFEEQQLQESKMQEFERKAALSEADVMSMKENLSSVNVGLELLSNLTHTRLSNALEVVNDLKLRLDRSVESQTTALTVASEDARDLDQRLSALIEGLGAQLAEANSSWQQNRANLQQIQHQVASFNNMEHNTEMALMRHSMDLKSHQRKMEATENLLQTITETVTLNSNQITLLTGEIMMRGDKQTMTTSFLSDMIANHTIQLEEIYNQISLMSSRLNAAPSRTQTTTLPPTTVPPTTTTTTATISTTTSISPPTGLSVLSSTSTEMIISWQPLSVLAADEYRIVIQNIEGAHSSTQLSALAPPVHVDHLQPGSQYLITIYAVKNNVLSPPLNGMGETAPRSSARPLVTTRATTTETTTTTTDSNAINVESIFPDTDNFECNFELPDICGFIDDTNDDFDWVRHNGTTPSSDTGPPLDHTLGNDQGYYMFIEGSRPRRSGHIARLISPLMEPTSGKCLEFYFHMFGVGTGDINVLIERLDDSSSRKIWEESGNHGNQWKRGRATLSENAPFRIIFEAVRGSDYHSDSAIDDVIIRDGSCPTPIIQCDFSASDLCGFTQDSNDDFDWETHSGATSSADTGPITDHTSGTISGIYLFLEASNPRYQGEITRISSPPLKPSAAQCLQFYYHMHGVDTGALNVYIRLNGDTNNLGNPIWTKSGPQGNEWFLGRATIVAAHSFQIVFEGVRGVDYHGDIALDDVLVSDGPCDLPVCPVGRRFEDHCYKVEKDGHTYQDASNICEANGGILAAIKTQSQQDFIRDLVSGEVNRWTLFWIGISDSEREGQFVYSDGTPVVLGESAFGAWAPGEPNDALGDEDCVNMEYAAKNRRWNDVPCNRELWFICQYPASL